MGLEEREFVCLNYKTAVQDQSLEIPISKLNEFPHFGHGLSCIELAALWIIFAS